MERELRIRPRNRTPMGNLKNETMKTEDTHFKPKLKLELERQLELDFCFSGSAAEGAALLSPPTPRDEGSGVRVNKRPNVS